MDDRIFQLGHPLKLDGSSHPHKHSAALMFYKDSSDQYLKMDRLLTPLDNKSRPKKLV